MAENTRAKESSPAPSTATSPSRFGMAQATVIVGFVAATVILRLAAHIDVRDIVILLGTAGGIGVAVLLAASMKNGDGGGRRLLRRLLNAALTPGSGN